MLHNFYVIAVSIILELSSSSPVYNLQPAYITANIGSTGRNIRNLPCISRRTNQSGVCMFAIDCLKSNGTHLGTCIDRFYFGSCCHVPPMAEISENTIDSSIIPNREPPHRINNIIANTNKADPVTAEKTTEKTTVTSISTSVKPLLTTTKEPIKYDTNTTNKNSSISIINLPTNTTGSSNKTSNTSNSINNTSNINNIGTIHVKQTTAGITSTFSETTTYMYDTTSQDNKFSTFQMVENNNKASSLPSTLPQFSTTTTTTTIETMLKPVSTITPSQISKPKPVNNISTHLTNKPIIFTSVLPHRTTISPLLPTDASQTLNPVKTKPTKTTKIPIKSTTKPYKINKTTVKPVTVSPIKVSTIFTKLPLQTTTPGLSPSSSTTSSVISTTNNITTSLITIWTTTSKIPPTYKPKPIQIFSPKPTNSIPTRISETTQLPNEINVNELVNGTSVLETINGNPATNEIEYSESPNKLGTVIPHPVTLTPNLTETTTKPGLVTWQPDLAETPQNTSTSGPDTWQPVTTPDGWVLLPSISTITESMSSTSMSSSGTEKMPSITTTPPSLEVFTTKTSIVDSANVSMTTTAMDTEEYVLSTVQQIIMNTTNLPDTDTVGMTTEVYGSGAESNVTESALNISKPVNMSDFTDVCGRRMHPEARIVGGEKSTFGRWPWQISLRQWRTSTYLHKCGAALLNENWAITAAHCVDNVPPSDLLLRLGEHDLSTESEPYLHQERRVQIVASHPQFDPRTFEYDLALLRFYEPVAFQPNILPVCVPQTDETFVGRTAHVTGWGRLYEDGPLPSVLQEVSVPVINNTVCESMYRAAGYIEHIPYIFICAGWRRGGFDSCEGDSGGPMVIQREDKRFLLAGVISWGIGCAEPNQPGVYTRISEFRDWINQILQF